MAIFVTETAVVLGTAQRPRVPHTRRAHGVGISCIGLITEGDFARQTGRAMRDAFEHGLQWSDVLVLTDELQRRWPLVFNPLHRRPLKTGVHHDIIAAMPEVNRYLLAITMRRWCQHVDYLRGIALGRHRHSLDGEAVSDLSPEEREAARITMAEGPRAMGREGGEASTGSWADNEQISVWRLINRSGDVWVRPRVQGFGKTTQQAAQA